MSMQSRFGLWRAIILMLAIVPGLHISTADARSEAKKSTNVVGDVQLETSCATEV